MPGSCGSIPRAAWRIPGVATVITADDVPGRLTYGLISQDQPVFATDVVRYVGEPVAAVAADHPETCRRALEAIVVEYEVLAPLTDPEAAIAGIVAPIHPDGNVLRHQRIVHGDVDATGDVTVEGTYTIGMQDQAFLGLEAALALPDSGGGGVELFIATQWLHEDRKQIAACLGLPEEQVRLTLGGVGGAFGAREDISLQVHTCLLALRTGRPVKIQYGRQESFLGHVHRHPATIWMRHHATADGRLVKIEARFVFDGGAYASTSSAVLCNAITHTQGPYRCDNAVVDGYAARTNNLPCGAMRGFGVVQACFAHESQMDLLAEACGLDPVEVRLRNAMQTGDRLITGQVVESVAPVARCIRETAALPLPVEPVGGLDGDPLRLPGGSGLTADRDHVVRGVGWGVSIKNLMYSEGFDDFSTARCRLADGVATLKFATAEVGQGFVTIAQQIARTILGVDEVVLEPMDTSIGSAGSTSASRQTWMSGGAVDSACRAVRERLFEHVARQHGLDPLQLVIDDDAVVDTVGTLRVPVAEATAGQVFEEELEYHHRPTDRPRRAGPGQLPHGVRLRRPPRRRRRRSRARPGAGGADRHRAGRRSGAEPAVGPGPDRGRHRPGPRPGGDGGDRPGGRPHPQRLVHRLPAADLPRRPRGRRQPGGGARSAGPARAPRAWASRRASRSRRPSWRRSGPRPGGRSPGSRCDRRTSCF